MKKVTSKLQSLVNRIQSLLEQFDEIKSGLEEQRYELEGQDDLTDKAQRKYDSLSEDIEYIDDVYYALDVLCRKIALLVRFLYA